METPLVRGRAESLSYRTQSFDRVFCIYAVHHFTDKPRFLAEARQVLRPQGGLMSLSLDPHAGLDRWWVYNYFHETLDLDKQRYPSTSELREEMSKAGFRRCETSVAEHLTMKIPATLRLHAACLSRVILRS